MTTPASRVEVAQALAALVKRRRAYRRKSNVVTMDPVDPSAAVEARYYANLRHLLEPLIQSTLALVDRGLASRGGLILDADRDDAEAIARGVGGLLQQLVELESLPAQVAEAFVVAGEGSHRRAFRAIAEKAMGVDLRAIISEQAVAPVIGAVVEENVALIKTIPQEYHDRVIEALRAGFATGSDSHSIRRAVLDIGLSSFKRARLIARDQTAKLNTRLNQERQRAVGVERYQWRTSQDARVRPSHEANEGKVFRWDNPPAETGHPGTDVQCRCTARPVLFEIDTGGD